MKHSDVPFSGITETCLHGYEERLIGDNIKTNTRAIHFRNIRAIFNRAIRDKAVSRDLYPFHGFRIKTEWKQKESLTAEEVKSLSNYPFRTNALRMARDYWMLSFFLCGISPIDLYYLKKPNMNRLSFVRQKERNNSHEVIKIAIQPEAQSIIDQYKADAESEYLLNFEHKYVSYEVFKSFVTKKIHEIAKTVNTPGLTLYWARYSWATIADSLDINEKTISKGLGHVDKTIAGRHYIAFDWSRVDRANRQVINYIFGETPDTPPQSP